jgi:hypothetical protein
MAAIYIRRKKIEHRSENAVSKKASKKISKAEEEESENGIERQR